MHVGQFQDVARLAAGRRAGVQHAHAVLQIQQRRGQLRASILYGDDALLEAGDQRHADRLVQAHGKRSHLARRDTRFLQHSQIRFDRALAAIHAQGQWRHGIAGRQNGLPVARVSQAQRIDPPLRIIPLRQWLLQGRFQQGLALAQETPQHGIHHALGMRQVRVRGGHRDSLVDHREFFVRLLARLGGHQRQRAAQQPGQHRRLRRLRRHQANQGFAAAQLAHGTVGNILDGAARLRAGVRLRKHLGQRLRQGRARAHLRHGIGGAQQAKRQRVGAQIGLEAWLQDRLQVGMVAGTQFRCGRRLAWRRLGFQFQRGALVHSYPVWLRAVGCMVAKSRPRVINKGSIVAFVAPSGPSDCSDSCKLRQKTAYIQAECAMLMFSCTNIGMLS